MDLFIDLDGFDVTVMRISNNRYYFSVYHKSTQKSEVITINEAIERFEVMTEDNEIKLEIKADSDNPKRIIEFSFGREDVLSVDVYKYYTQEYIENLFSKIFDEEE